MQYSKKLKISQLLEDLKRIRDLTLVDEINAKAKIREKLDHLIEQINSNTGRRESNAQR